MERVIQNMRNQQDTMGFTGKLQNDQEQNKLRRDLQDAEDRLHALERENRQMKQDLERKEAYQSAVNSDTRAFSEKLELLQRENADKEDKLRQV